MDASTSLSEATVPFAGMSLADWRQDIEAARNTCDYLVLIVEDDMCATSVRGASGRHTHAPAQQLRHHRAVLVVARTARAPVRHHPHVPQHPPDRRHRTPPAHGTGCWTA